MISFVSRHEVEACSPSSIVPKQFVKRIFYLQLRRASSILHECRETGILEISKILQKGSHLLTLGWHLESIDWHHFWWDISHTHLYLEYNIRPLITNKNRMVYIPASCPEPVPMFRWQLCLWIRNCICCICCGLLHTEHAQGKGNRIATAISLNIRCSWARAVVVKLGTYLDHRHSCPEVCR